MCTSADTARLAQAEEVASLVLGAERTAISEIENFKRKTLLLIVASWLRAAMVHKRTEARMKRLREQMRADAQDRHMRICRETEAIAADAGEDASLLAPLDSAIVRVIAELAANSGSS
jgi:hypothetical protein